MSAAKTVPSPGGQALRRTRYAAGSIVLIAAAVIAAVLACIIGTRFHARWDLTATREHSLSPRTLGVLSSLDTQSTIIVSADNTSLGAGSRRRMTDLLDAIKRASPKIEVAWIDTGAPSGQAQFQSLLSSLIERDATTLALQQESLSRAAESVAALRQALPAVSDLAGALSDAIERAGLPPRREELERLGAVARTLVARLDPAVEAIRAAAGNTIAGIEIPAPDSAQERAGPVLSETARAMAAVADFAAAFQSSGLGSPVLEAARALGASASAVRDRAARASDDLARLRATDPLIVARVLQATRAVLITSPRGTLAIEFSAIFPSGAEADPALQGLFAGEELISTALASLSAPVRPVLVFVHAEAGRLFDDRGAPSPAALRAFRRLFERLRFARIDAAEWAVADTPMRPDPALEASGTRRPVIWFILPPPSRAGIDPRQAPLIAERQERVRNLGRAVGTLITAGESILLSVDPSDRPAIGDPDSIVAPLESMGLRVDSGRPLLRRESSPQGPLTYTLQVVRGGDDSHPIGNALNGLAIVMPWASAIDRIPSEGATTWPILTLPATPDIWGESQWLTLRDLVARGLARPLDPVALADPPVPNAGRDLITPPGGSPTASAWVVAAAAERPRSGLSPQRLVVVGSPTWFDDLFMGATENVAGRRSLRFPGNAELLDASLCWLAGQDEMIAPGPQVRDVPRIRPIEPGALSALRWAVALAPPVLVLILGALLRAWRG